MTGDEARELLRLYADQIRPSAVVADNLADLAAAIDAVLAENARLKADKEALETALAEEIEARDD